MIYPSYNKSVLFLNLDMPKYIKYDYLEAMDIVERSPRGACSLLRLAIEKICDEKIKKSDLKIKSHDLNDKIKLLDENNIMPSEIKEYFEIIREIGNISVHPYDMPINSETVDIVRQLFLCFNNILNWAYSYTPANMENLRDFYNKIKNKPKL